MVKSAEMSDKVLVTGGAGFLGSELVRQLLEAGKEVVVADNLIGGSFDNLEGLDCRLEPADVRDADKMRPLVEECGVIFHLASLGAKHSAAEVHDVNASATLQVLQLAREAEIERFVHVSSSDVYGVPQKFPIDESHPTLPATVYGASKLAGEGYARAFHRAHGLPVVVVRPFLVYGKKSPPPEPVDGKQTRDLLYVEDAAAAIMAAGFAKGVEGETINICSGKEADTAKAKRLLGFEARVTLEDGLKRLRP
jgi:UDP-glucose 4-epimerase